MENKINYWDKRANKYNTLDWLNKDKLSKEILKEVNPKKHQIIVDLGTGTGKFAELIAKKAGLVFGIDFSTKMLKYCGKKFNLKFLEADLRNNPFPSNIFDTAIASHVFHHILKNTQKAMDESYRILDKEGKMILVEGIPPIPEMEKDYTKIFKLKEKRIVFSEQKLKNLLQKSRFKKVKSRIFYLKDISVKNWLNASGCSQKIQNKIYNLHKNGSIEFKKAYKLKEVKNDCLITIKIVILTGFK